MITHLATSAWHSWWGRCMTMLALILVIAGCTVPPIQTPGSVPPVEATTAPESEESAETPVAEAEPTEVVAMPTETHKGIPVGFTAEGYPFKGLPNAPVTIYEYSDYQCPFCSRYFVQTEPAINDNFVRSDEVRVVFRDFPIVQLHPNAPAAHVAALCVAEQGSATDYWEMHDKLFQTQTVWSNLPDPQPELVKLAEAVGVDMVRFNDCVASGAMETKIEQALAEGQGLGITGTPSFNIVQNSSGISFLLVGAQPFDQFASAIASIAAGESPAQAQQGAEGEQAGNQETPLWATVEGLKPDPERPGYTMAGDQYRGNPDAKVVVIEFSDFQCPYCRRHVQETQPTLDETFVDTDEIFWVFKNFPLTIHPQAEAAGIAAECAADQDKFWEMHDLLFSSVEQWSISNPNPVFEELAAQLSLDTDAFNTCLTAGDAQARVQSDLQDGSPFVQGTPTFIVLFGEDGRIIPGALPADRFTQALQEVLDTVAQ